MPSALIAHSIGQVFFQEATKEKQKTGKAIKTFNSTIKKLFIIGIPLFGILYFIVEDLFAFVFGEEWRIAGIYAQIVMPLFFVRFVVSSVTVINSIFEKQKISLCWQLILLLLSVGSLYISSLYFTNFEDFLILFTGVISLHYLVLFFILKRISEKGKL